MVVDVQESGGQDQPICSQYELSRSRPDITEARDPVAANLDAGGSERAAGAIRHACARDQETSFHRRIRARRGGRAGHQSQDQSDSLSSVHSSSFVSRIPPSGSRLPTRDHAGPIAVSTAFTSRMSRP
jgi:hypothetical protein